LLCGAALAVESLLFPPLFSLSVVLAFTVFVLLAVRQKERFDLLSAAPALRWIRLTLFLGLHAGLLATAWKYLPTGEAAAYDLSYGGLLAPALRLLALAPALALYPLRYWLQLATALRAETVAALVVLFTYFPYRLSAMLWEHTQNDLAALVHLCLTPLFSDTFHLLAEPPLVGTMRYPVSLIYYCSGIQGIFLFQGLFGLLVLWDWKRLRAGRVLTAYAGGLVLMEAANVVRILTLITAGTLAQEAEMAEAVHLNAGWIYFTLTFIGFLALTYRWMLRKEPQPGTASSPALSARSVEHYQQA